jgi:hypothetical protein
MWKDVNNLDSKAILIQKTWRRFVIQNWLKLAGPGVLKRKICFNTEELATLDSKDNLHPLDYFAFEENDKVYWFDIRSITESSIKSVEPLNPYTRTPLTTDTRQRLRKLGVIRFRRNMPNLHNVKNQDVKEIIDINWIYICQIITENGFFDMSHRYFSGMNRSQLLVFTSLLQNDFIAWRSEHPAGSRREKYVIWFKRLVKEFSIPQSPIRLSFLVSKILLTILNDYPNPYPICFIIMSGMARL